MQLAILDWGSAAGFAQNLHLAKSLLHMPMTVGASLVVAGASYEAIGSHQAAAFLAHSLLALMRAVKTCVHGPRNAVYGPAPAVALLQWLWRRYSLSCHESFATATDLLGVN